MYYYGPMMNGEGWGWGILMVVLWLAFFAVMATVVIRLLRSHDSGTLRKSDPLDIAKERYAKGEITKADYEQLKKDLSK